MLLSNAIRSLFKPFLEPWNIGYSTMGPGNSESKGDLEKDEAVKTQIKKAVEAERLQAYLERIVDRIADLKKYFLCQNKAQKGIQGSWPQDGGDYRMNQARERLLRLQKEANIVKNRIHHLKCQIYYDF